MPVTGAKRKRNVDSYEVSELPASIPTVKGPGTASDDSTEIRMTKNARKIAGLVDLANRTAASKVLGEVNLMIRKPWFRSEAN